MIGGEGRRGSGSEISIPVSLDKFPKNVYLSKRSDLFTKGSPTLAFLNA